MIFLLFIFPVATFDPDTRFISNVLSRLEAVMGVHIVSVLANIHYQLTTTSGVQLQPQIDNYGRRIPPDPQTAPGEYVEEVISLWSAGHSPCPPTWRRLLQVLQDIGQLELRQQIEAFMKGMCTDMLYIVIIPSMSSVSFHCYSTVAVNINLYSIIIKCYKVTSMWKRKPSMFFFQIWRLFLHTVVLTGILTIPLFTAY